MTTIKIHFENGFIEIIDSHLAHEDVSEVKKHLKQLKDLDDDVYFIDEAYQLVEAHNSDDKTVLDYLLAEIESLIDKMIFVFADYRRQMKKFFEHNSELLSRLSYVSSFEDYIDVELLRMLQFQMSQFYKIEISIEDEVDELYMRIVVRKLERDRDRDEFENARALKNMFQRIRERQAERLIRQRKKELNSNDFYITKKNLIDSDSSKTILICDAWTKLQQLIDLKTVKNSVKFMIDSIETNYERELKKKKLINVSLNRIFLDSFDIEKTIVVKLYDRILTDIEMLSNDEDMIKHDIRNLRLLTSNVLIVVKNSFDFIDNVIEQFEINTKAILATTVEKVLVIDEAYMLYSDSNKEDNFDVFKTIVIDTIVAEIQSVLDDDRCLLLLRYESQMMKMFQNVNLDLIRRFQLSNAFWFENFSDNELQEILLLKLANQNLKVTSQIIFTIIDVLSRLRNELNFDNDDDVKNLISKVKTNYQARQFALSTTQRSVDFIFESQNFDSQYDRAFNVEINLERLFQEIIDCENIVSKLNEFLKVIKEMRAQDLESREQISMNFIFKESFDN